MTTIDNVLKETEFTRHKFVRVETRYVCTLKIGDVVNLNNYHADHATKVDLKWTVINVYPNSGQSGFAFDAVKGKKELKGLDTDWIKMRNN